MLPAETSILSVELGVSNLQRSLAFYEGLLGFRRLTVERDHTELSASGSGPAQVVLVQLEHARPKPPRTTGLFHVAIRVPDRRALGETLRRLVEHGWLMQGFADHGVSEAIYLADPDGNGLEIYRDRPRDQWPRKNGSLEMVTNALDVEGLLAEAEQHNLLWTGINPASDIGHVHLQVSDLQTAEDFYVGLVGFDVTQRTYPGALFVAAGGYHHHVGLNVWSSRGAPSPPANAVGLREFTVRVTKAAALTELTERLKAAGLLDGEDHGKGNKRVFSHDPDRQRLAFQLYND
jgi:catechol 2,3-dioxygenase